MARREFRVSIYYSTFETKTVEAESGEEAISLSRSLPLNHAELSSNLEPWEEADTAEES